MVEFPGVHIQRDKSCVLHASTNLLCVKSKLHTLKVDVSFAAGEMKSFQRLPLSVPSIRWFNQDDQFFP